MTDLNKEFYLDVDVGSISSNLAIINENQKIIERVYIRTEGKPIQSVQKIIRILHKKLGYDMLISGMDTTGSAR
jgi:activator of 2-hydroxyglutaryl-CoA dehydratase